MNRSEMGQGVHTALAMLVAEELDLPLARVRAGAGRRRQPVRQRRHAGRQPAVPPARQRARPGDPAACAPAEWVRRASWRASSGINVTGGSTSVADAWEPCCALAAATARAQLLGAASLRWKLPADELTVADGVIAHAVGADARTTASWRAWRRPRRPARCGSSRASDWKLIGTRRAAHRPAGQGATAAARFGLDVRLPGRVYAVVRHCADAGRQPGRASTSSAALQLPGVERVVRLGPLCRLDRRRWPWSAAAAGMRSEARAALAVDWQPPPAGALDSDAIMPRARAAARAAAAERRRLRLPRPRRCDRRAAPAPRARVEARVPRALPGARDDGADQLHRAVADGRVELWAPTQVPSFARAMAARVAGVPESMPSTLHVTYLGGGFGRRLEVDVVGQAVRVALETGGRPVQLVWSREEDIDARLLPPGRRGACCRPGSTPRAAAQPDDRRAPATRSRRAGWSARCPRWPAPIDPPDKTTSEGLFDLPYAIAAPAHRARRHAQRRAGRLLALGRAIRTTPSSASRFIDELAHAAEQRPGGLPAGAAGGHAAPCRGAEAAPPSRPAGAAPLPAGRARGVALHESFGSIVAQVVEVSLVDGAGRACTAWSARSTCGTVVNPGIVAQQMESAIVFGLAAALYGRIDIVDSVGAAEQLPEPPDPHAGRRRRASRRTWWPARTRRAASASPARRRWRRRWPMRCSR